MLCYLTASFSLCSRFILFCFFSLIFTVACNSSGPTLPLPPILTPEEVDHQVLSNKENQSSSTMTLISENGDLGDITPKQILYWAQNGKDNLKTALEMYDKWKKIHGRHDDELIQQIASLQLQTSLRGKKLKEQVALAWANLMAKNRTNWQFYHDGIYHCEPIVALICLQGLFELGDRRAESLLLHDVNLFPSEELRFEIAYYLAQRNYSETIYHLQNLKGNISSNLQAQLPFLFALLDSPKAEDELLDFLYNSNQETVINAILAIAEMGKSHLAANLIPMLERSSPQIIKAAATALGGFNYTPAREILLGLLQTNKDPSVQLSIRYALYRMGDFEQIPVIINAVILDPTISGVHLISHFDSAKDMLVELMDSANQQIAFNAVLALISNGHGEAVTRMIPFLDPARDLGIETIPSSSFPEYRFRLNSSYLWRKEPMKGELSLRMKEHFLGAALTASANSLPSFIQELIPKLDPRLIPCLVESLQKRGDSIAQNLLMHLWQYPGQPLLRNYAALALFQMNLPQIRQQLYWQIENWLMKEENFLEVISLRPYVDWQNRNKGNSQTITPEMRSQLLISFWRVLAESQEEEALDLLLRQWKKYPRGNQLVLSGILVKHLTN